MPTGGGVWQALEHGARVGCEVVQLFVKNNKQWLGRALRPEEVQRYQSQRAVRPFAAVFGHTGYLINLGAPPSANRDKSLQSLIQEIEIAGQIGLPFLVLHPGSHLGQGEAAGLSNIVSGLDETLAATKTTAVRIALETTAGQGTSLGHAIAHLAAIIARVQCPERLGVCLDTAHLFAAGYDLRKPQGWAAVLQELDSLIGLDRVLACHLNDSQTGLGSRVDRHAGIGRGKIGRAAFRHIVNEPRFADLPGCLETPKSADLHEDVENLRTLRALMRPRRPRASAAPRRCVRRPGDAPQNRN
jgi:deoxyribonuclease-4